MRKEMVTVDGSAVSRSITEMSSKQLVSNQRPLIVDLLPFNGQRDESARVSLAKITERVFLSMPTDEQRRVVFLGDKTSAECLKELAPRAEVALMNNASFRLLIKG